MSGKRVLKIVAYAIAVMATLGSVQIIMDLLNQSDSVMNVLGVLLAIVIVCAWLRFGNLGAVREWRRLLPLVLLSLVAASSANCTRVDAGYAGIKINYSGTYRGVQDVPMVTGWTFYRPGLSTVLSYPTFVQNVVWTKSPIEGNPANEEITFTNADKMQISVDVSLAFHLEEAKIPAFYLKFRTDELVQWENGFLRNVARDQFNTHGGKYGIDQIMGDNSAFIADARKSLQDEIGKYGVLLDQFGIIGAPRPPASVTAAIDASSHAKQFAIQKQNELAQSVADAAKLVATAKGKADAQIAEATGYAESVRIRSLADAASNERITRTLTPLLLQSDTIQKWDGVLPIYLGPGVPSTILPIKGGGGL
jgi:regulator of protease activity HflC (stomatin/prohibitin superfamily)